MPPGVAPAADNHLRSRVSVEDWNCWNLKCKETSQENRFVHFQRSYPGKSYLVSVPREAEIGLLPLPQLCPMDIALSAISWLPLHHSKLGNTFFSFFFFLQSASCRLSNCSVIYCKWLQKEKKKGKEKEKIPRRYNIVLSVNQTFPVILIACVSLMYFILLKSFETLQLSSYRPLCGYH